MKPNHVHDIWPTLVMIFNFDLEWKHLKVWIPLGIMNMDLHSC
jgi:hypothetical protein